MVVNMSVALAAGWNGSACPVCLVSVTPDQLQAVSRHLTSMLGNLELHCDYYYGLGNGCQKVVKLNELRSHVAGCHHAAMPVPASGSISPALDVSVRPVSESLVLVFGL